MSKLAKLFCHRWFCLFIKTHVVVKCWKPIGGLFWTPIPVALLYFPNSSKRRNAWASEATHLYRNTERSTKKSAASRPHPVILSWIQSATGFNPHSNSIWNPWCKPSNQPSNGKVVTGLSLEFPPSHPMPFAGKITRSHIDLRGEMDPRKTVNRGFLLDIQVYPSYTSEVSNGFFTLYFRFYLFKIYVLMIY